MKNEIRIKYDAKLSIEANAKLCGVSVPTMRLWLRQEKIDRHFDAMYTRFTAVKKLQKRNMTPRNIANKTGFALNTVKKYMAMDSLVKKPNKVSTFDISKEDNIIKSVSTNQQEILNGILKLYIPQGIFDADFTFSKGIFYKDGIVPMPRLKYDKYPENGVLPLEDAECISDGSLKSCVVDLPFLITQRQWTAKCKMAQRFNCFDSIDDATEANLYMLRLCHRKLKRKGILVFKTMDLYKTKQIWISRYVQEWAEEIGFELIDMFILIAPSKVLSRGMKQKVSRKYHSYFFVFKKR